MSEQRPATAQEAFDPEVRQGQADWDAYLQSRPYEDDLGNIHNPETGQFINADAYFDEQRQELEAADQTSYEDMSMSDLASKLAQAEHHGDRTMENDVHEVLHDKITKQHKKTKSSRDTEHNAQRMDKLIDRVMTVKDKELERLQEKTPELEQDPFFTPERIEALKGSAFAADGETSFEILGYKSTDYKAREVRDQQDNITKVIDPHHLLYAAHKNEKGELREPFVNRLKDFWFSKKDADHIQRLKDAGWVIEDLYGSDFVTVRPPKEGETVTPGSGPELPKSTGADRSEGAEADKEPEQTTTRETYGEEDAPTDVMKRPFDWERDTNGDFDDLTTGKGLRARVRRLMGRASAAIRDLPVLALLTAQEGVERARSYFEDEERGRRRRITGMVAGAVVLAGAGATVAYLELKGNSIMGNLTDGRGAKGGHNPEMHEHVRKAVLHSGDNPWTLSEHQLKAQGIAHPTDAQIEAYDKRMAHLNPDVYSYYGDSSYHIPSGTELKLPKE